MDSLSTSTAFSRVLIEFLLLSCLLLGWISHIDGASATDEQRLLERLINASGSGVRPILDLARPTNVTLDITFNSIIDVDEKHQILSSSVWIRQSWIAETLSWDPAEYGGVNQIVVSSQLLWQPDTVLYNNIFEEFDSRLDTTVTRVRVYSSGFVYWAMPYVFKTMCKIDVTDFPFDSQRCPITFGAWQYDQNEVNLINNKRLATVASTRVENGEWTVEKVAIERRVIFYQCCPNQPYPEISFVIHMQRRSLFYVVNLVLPNFLITLLAFFSFFIPVECGERMSFVITVLLSMTVFLLLVAESIPPTSEAVPVIGVYYTFCIVEVFLALVATGISFRINYSYMFGDGLSPWLKTLLFEKVGPLLRFDVKKTLRKGYVEYLDTKARAPCDCCLDSPGGVTRDEEMQMICKHNAGNVNHGPDSGGLPHKEIPGFVLNGQQAGNGSAKCRVITTPVESELIRAVKCHQHSDRKRTESKLAAAIVDRAFLWVFNTVFVICTAAILGSPSIKSNHSDG